MALTCPRCGTDVPTEALYCPYCSLPKPKRGFASEAKGEAPTPAGQPKPQAVVRPQVAVKSAAKHRRNRSAKPATTGPEKPRRRLRPGVLSVAALVAVFSVGIYTFVVPMVYSEQAEPKTVLQALERLRREPSNDPSITIDARLLRELETSRRVGNLTAYQGWTVRPIKGTKSKVVLAFSYVEVGDVHQSAEWIADLDSGGFTPQTELATAVSGK